MNPRVAILASGSGTTAEAFIRASAAAKIAAQPELVIASRSNSGIIQRVENLNKELDLSIRCIVISSKTHPAAITEHVDQGAQTAAEEAAILAALAAGSFDLIALMGYMKKIGPALIEAFGWLPSYSSIFQAKMVNTHPGLLPDTKGFYGINIQKYVLDNGLPYGGQTFHVVSDKYDEGPIIAEHKVPVQDGDTPETLFERVQEVEKKHLPYDIDDFIKARLAFIAHHQGGKDGKSLSNR